MIRFKRLLESYIIYVFCILSALALCSCGKEYDSFLQEANEIITVDPDSALTILKTRPIRSFSKERTPPIMPCLSRERNTIWGCITGIL